MLEGNSSVQICSLSRRIINMVLIFKAIILLILTYHVLCKEMFKLFDLVENESDVSVDCISDIIRKYFPCGTYMTVVDTSKTNELIKKLNAGTNCYSVIVRSFDTRYWLIHNIVYLITTENISELSDGMDRLTKEVFWNPRAKFVVHLPNANSTEIEEGFGIFLKYRMYNATLISRNQINLLVEVFTFFPFENKKCGQYLDTVHSLGECKDYKNIDFFPNKLPDGLRNCTVKVTATDALGNKNLTNFTSTEGTMDPELYFLNIVAAREGFCIKYTIHEKYEMGFGVVMQNRTVTGLLGYLQNKTTDIVVGTIILVNNRAEVFDYVWGFSYVAFNLYTPAIDVQIWQKVYREYGIVSWLLIILTYFIVVVVCNLLFKNTDRVNIALKLWGYIFINSDSKLTKVTRLRPILIFWIWFTFFIGNFYTTALFSLMSTHSTPKRHISPDNLKSFPYSPCINNNTRQFFQYAYNTTLPKGQPVRQCEFANTSLKQVANEKTFFAIDLENKYKFYEYKYIDEHGKRKLDSWEFTPNFVVAMFLTRGYPLRDKLQLYAGRMLESGLLKNQAEKTYRQSFVAVQKSAKKKFEPLSTHDLIVYILILAFGWVVSLICLCIEIQKKTKTN